MRCTSVTDAGRKPSGWWTVGAPAHHRTKSRSDGLDRGSEKLPTSPGWISPGPLGQVTTCGDEIGVLTELRADRVAQAGEDPLDRSLALESAKVPVLSSGEIS